MYYRREIAHRLDTLLTQFPAVILTGARQTGKTTLLKKRFPLYNYVTLDLPSLADQAENDSQQFLSQNPPPLIVDEAQYAPGLFRHLKIAIDQNREKVGQYIITGSQKFNLMKEVSDSLAGRCVWLELEGLGLTELNQENVDLNDLQQIYRIITRGSLPELWKKPNLSLTDYYRTYLATYLERDVRQITNISSLRNFERFIRVCAARNGQLLNKTDLVKDVGVTANTVAQWLSILEACNQIALLEPYFGNTGKRIIKSPKLYFCELGLLCFLLGINESSIQTTPFIRNIWETYIFSEFRKWIKNTNQNARLWFYRDNRAREVDFILESDGNLDFFEVKWTTNPVQKDSKVMNAVFDDLKAKNTKTLISMGEKHLITRAPHSSKLLEGTRVLNAGYFIRTVDV